MPTPTGAIPRDLGTELAAIKAQLRDLTSVALRRRQLSVTEGDFTVSGGGSVIVKDGGGLQTTYSGTSQEAVRFGPAVTTDGRPAYALRVRDESNEIVFSAHRVPFHPDFPAYPDGIRVVQCGSPAQSLDQLYAHVQNLYLLDAAGAEITMASGGVSLAGIVRMPTIGTTAAGANLVWTTGGSILRSTSSLRYKTDVQIPRIDVEAVLALQPKVYRTREQVAELGEDAPTYAGFIAEEAAELGLDHWVTYDDEGRPDAFNYAQWGVAQQAVLRQHQERITELEQKLSDQAATLAAMEERLAAAGL